MFCVVIRFARGAQILKHSNTRFSPDFAGEKRFALLANSCNRKPNYLPQRRQGAKLMNPRPSSRANARDLKGFLPAVEMTSLPDLASLRLCGRHIRIRESSITGKFAQARHYDKHVGLSFWIAVRRARRKKTFCSNSIPSPLSGLRVLLCLKISVACANFSEPTLPYGMFSRQNAKTRRSDSGFLQKPFSWRLGAFAGKCFLRVLRALRGE